MKKIYDVSMTNKFKKALRLAKRQKKDLEKLNVIVDLLQCGEPLPENNKDHALKGNFKGYRECHIEPDWLLLYKIKDDILVLSLSNLGTHSDIFDL